MKKKEKPDLNTDFWETPWVIIRKKKQIASLSQLGGWLPNLRGKHREVDTVPE